MMSTRPQLHLTAATVAVLITAWFAYNRSSEEDSSTETSSFGVSEVVWQQYEYEVVPIENGAVGPESFAFDPRGEGPYTGVSDGRIIKWHQTQNRWLDFAFTSSNSRGEDECGAVSEHPKREHICRRPLGLCFSEETGELYVADAYKGLLLVNPNGTATQILSQVEGQPLSFTNGLDIDQRTQGGGGGAVYFTSSSSKYHRRNYVSLILSGDRSGRLMKYEPQSQRVSILLNNLTFPNGVALSKDGTYILIVETTNCRVLRYWLETAKAGRLEVFANLPGFPDNIKRSPRGGFWVGIYSRRENFVDWILSYPWIGKSLVKLPLDITKANSYLTKLKGSTGLAIRISEEGGVLEILEEKKGNKRRSISEVEERSDGVLWVGSVDAPFAAYYNPCGIGLKGKHF